MSPEPSIAPKAVTETFTPCGDAEFVLEIDVPSDVDDNVILNDATQIAIAIDELHRALGGHGLKVKHLEIYEDTRVPEVQHG